MTLSMKACVVTQPDVNNAGRCLAAALVRDYGSTVAAHQAFMRIFYFEIKCIKSYSCQLFRYVDISKYINVLFIVIYAL